MAKTTVGARPVAAETKGREIEGRTPPEILAGRKGGENVRRLLEWIQTLLRERKRRQRWEKYFQSGGMIR